MSEWRLTQGRRGREDSLIVICEIGRPGHCLCLPVGKPARCCPVLPETRHALHSGALSLAGHLGPEL